PGEPDRFERAHFFRIPDRLAAALPALAFELLHSFLDLRIGIYESLAGITHNLTIIGSRLSALGSGLSALGFRLPAPKAAFKPDSRKPKAESRQGAACPSIRLLRFALPSAAGSSARSMRPPPRRV